MGMIPCFRFALIGFGLAIQSSMRGVSGSVPFTASVCCIKTTYSLIAARTRLGVSGRYGFGCSMNESC